MIGENVGGGLAVALLWGPWGSGGSHPRQPGRRSDCCAEANGVSPFSLMPHDYVRQRKVDCWACKHRSRTSGEDMFGIPYGACDRGVNSCCNLTVEATLGTGKYVHPYGRRINAVRRRMPELPVTLRSLHKVMPRLQI